jgi:tRNA1(Val) A37 N6-methylase TrmN6
MGEITEGALLGGRLRYRQFRAGHRTGFEPVLLAAAVPAGPGERVLEAGTGAGAALLCLGARVPGLTGSGIESEAELAELANENLKNNGLEGFRVERCDVTLYRTAQKFDHALANPPWFGASSTPSPDAARRHAHQASVGLLAAWVAALSRALRPRGTLTLILPAAQTAAAMAALRDAGCGAVGLFPFWPRAGLPAKLILLSALKGAKGADRVLPGLTLHDEAGITAAAQRVLRDGAALFPGASERE